jgi:thiosulfate reductase cytochrome b subunit|tara:strand:- start:298 stop:480 length:183 start_codon:yes stop_codon:yes gene_type:complete
VFSRKAQSVMGHRITEPRPTLMAVWLVFLYVGVPLLVVTGLLDLAMQVFFGVCTGLWCLA